MDGFTRVYGETRYLAFFCPKKMISLTTGLYFIRVKSGVSYFS